MMQVTFTVQSRYQNNINYYVSNNNAINIDIFNKHKLDIKLNTDNNPNSLLFINNNNIYNSYNINKSDNLFSTFNYTANHNLNNNIYKASYDKVDSVVLDSGNTKKYVDDNNNSYIKLNHRITFNTSIRQFKTIFMVVRHPTLSEMNNIPTINSSSNIRRFNYIKYSGSSYLERSFPYKMYVQSPGYNSSNMHLHGDTHFYTAGNHVFPRDSNNALGGITDNRAIYSWDPYIPSQVGIYRYINGKIANEANIDYTSLSDLSVTRTNENSVKLLRSKLMVQIIFLIMVKCL